MTLLEVRNITKKFGGLVAVDQLSLTLDPGQIIGMIGPNGAGKTTAFNLISGIYKPDEGQVFLQGEDISNSRPDEICKKGLTRTFQVVKPFADISVLENVMVGAYNHTNDPRLARDKAFVIIENLGIQDIADQRAGDLPIASRKRIEIARAMATEPKIMLLDEAMAGLRPNETDDLIQIVSNISRQGIALLLVEHVMKIVMALSEHIIVINRGRKIAEGPPKEVVNNPLVIDAYLGENKSNDAN